MICILVSAYIEDNINWSESVHAKSSSNKVSIASVWETITWTCVFRGACDFKRLLGSMSYIYAITILFDDLGCTNSSH